MTTPHLTPKPRTPDQVWNFFNRKRDKPVNSKSSIWNCQTEPHGTVGVLTVPFSGRYVRDLESLKAMESHSLNVAIPSPTRKQKILSEFFFFPFKNELSTNLYATSWPEAR